MTPAAPKIFVGYKTRPAELPEPFVPEFSPPANYKDRTKIDEWLDQKKAEWVETSLSYPYLATFEQVFVSVHIPGVVPPPEPGRWDYRPPGSGKPPIALAVQTYLMKFFRGVWAGGEGGPKPIFLGFDPRTFLKIWGLECSLPENASPLPPSVWYGTNQYRDVGEALLPSEFKFVPLPWVLKRRGIAVPGWERPGLDPEQDARVAAWASAQLGFLAE